MSGPSHIRLTLYTKCGLRIERKTHIAKDPKWATCKECRKNAS